MKGEQYKELSKYFSENKKRSTTLGALHDILPLLMYVFYPLQIIALWVTKGIYDEQFLRFTFIPLGLLIFVTILRIIVNAQRPYEKFNYEPAVKKNTKGKSFPSRHTACAFIIAMAFLYIQVELGVVMLIIATLIGITRVLAGVHFIRDVVSGALLGIITGYIGFFLI